jgi:membrane-bound lytic murein transglycosylase D
MGTESAQASLPPLWDAAIPSRDAIAPPTAEGEPTRLSDADLHWPEFAPNHLRIAMQDRQGRVPPDFKVPPGLESKVRFWLEIYTLYSSETLVLYDDRHPEVVYEVMDFRELASQARSSAAYEILRERAIERRLKIYQDAFARLQRNPRPSSPSREMKNIIKAMHQLPHRHTLRELADGLRGQTGQRDQVLLGLRRFDRQAPFIERLFKGNGVPPELSRLALVESSFNPEAVSRAGARGAWQFMLASAKEFLVVDADAGIDERLSSLKTSVAAAKLLARNQRLLKSWPLTVTSYNSGVAQLLKIPLSDRSFGRVGRALTSCRNPHHLGYAGHSYYAEFLAMLYAEKYRDLFFPGSAPGPEIVNAAPPGFLRLAQGGTAAEVSRRLGITLQDFLALNPDVLSVRSRIPRGFRAAVPAEQGDFSVLMMKKPVQTVSSREIPPTG